MASHVALLLDGRPRRDGLFALHRCDNPMCVNPAHLWWGTQRENVHDAIAKGRLNRDGLAIGQRKGRRLPSYEFAEPEKPGRVEVTIGGPA